jgi:hypothetical protein
VPPKISNTFAGSSMFRGPHACVRSPHGGIDPSRFTSRLDPSGGGLYGIEKPLRNLGPRLAQRLGANVVVDRTRTDPVAEIMHLNLGVYPGKLAQPLDATGRGDHTIVTTLCPGGKERMRRLMNVIAAGRATL